MEKKQRFGLRKTTMGLVSAAIMGVTIIPIIGTGNTVLANTTLGSAEATHQHISQPPADLQWTANTVAEIENEIELQLGDQADSQEYVIQWGDTVWGITQAFGIDLDKFVEVNGIENPDLIYANDIVSLDVTKAITGTPVSEREDAQEVTSEVDSTQGAKVEEKQDEVKAPGGLETPKPTETNKNNDTDKVEVEHDDTGNFGVIDNDKEVDKPTPPTTPTEEEEEKEDEVDKPTPPTTPTEDEKEDEIDKPTPPTTPTEEEEDEKEDEVDKPTPPTTPIEEEDEDEGLDPNTPVEDGEELINSEIIKGEVVTLPTDVASTMGDLISTEEINRRHIPEDDPNEFNHFYVQTSSKYVIKHGIEYHVDPTLPAGEIRVVAEGQNGVLEIIETKMESFGEIYEDVEGTGQFDDFDVVGEYVRSEAQPEIIQYGTQSTDIKRDTVHVNVPFETEYVDNNQVEQGKTKVLVRGVNGIIEKIYETPMTNGTPTGKRELVSDEVHTDVVNQVIERGTMVVENKTETKQVRTAPKVVWQNNPNLKAGEERVKQQGQDKVVEISYTVRYENGKEVSRKESGRKVIGAGRDTIMERGTMVVGNKTETKQVRTAPKVVWQNNPNLKAGEERVKQQGQDKVVEISYTVRYENGKEVSRKESGRKTISAGRNTIMERGTKSEAKDPYAFDQAKLNTEMLALINAERASVGVGALSYNNTLQRGTSIRADEILSEDSLTVGGKGHVRPDGTSFRTAFKYLGNNRESYLGENIAQNWIDIEGLENVEAGKTTIEKVLAKQFFDQYLGSAGHYANMVNRGYAGFATDIRVAENGKIFNVQIFTLPTK